MTKNINAPLLSKMIISGANNLSNNRELVDALNVFPVPDGDTGTNMSLTFINAARGVEEINSSDVTEVANAVAKARAEKVRAERKANSNTLKSPFNLALKCISQTQNTP